jgi:transcriptional repressor NrdR
MECPNCGKTDNKVTDSRLSKDAMTIRRRRQCLACSERFTTYEATEERLLSFLITKNAGQGTTIPSLRTMLSFMSDTLKILSKETENLIGKMEKRKKAQAAQEARKKVRERKAAKRKAESLMIAETVLKIIKRHRRGIDISKLKDKTGIDNKIINKIASELRKEGKIKSLRRGFYIKT